MRKLFLIGCLVASFATYGDCLSVDTSIVSKLKEQDILRLLTYEDRAFMQAFRDNDVPAMKCALEYKDTLKDVLIRNFHYTAERIKEQDL